MKMKYFLTALLLLPSLAMSAMTQARTNESSGLPRAYAIEGREIAAPPWSIACMSDQGPRQCDEPMWVYGSPPRSLSTRTRSDMRGILRHHGHRCRVPSHQPAAFS